MAEGDISLECRKKDGILVVQLGESRIDSSRSPELKTELLKLIAAGNRRILVNLQNVATIDSSGLGALTFGVRQIDEIDGTLAVCCLQAKVQSLFRIAHLERVFDTYDSEDEGIAALRD